jgi:hypothetical protein
MRNINVKQIPLSLLAVALIGGCTIDARSEADGGAEYEFSYSAPEAASSVALCDNFDREWRCSAEVVGRMVAWSGELDGTRLCAGPAEGGYLLNFSFGVPPYFAVTQDGLGGFVRVGELSPVSGPLPTVVEAVDNGRAGGNYWLHLAEGQCD